MSRKYIILIIVAVLAGMFCFFGCAEQDRALYYLARGQIIPMFQQGDAPAAKITVLETDDYGRILFRADNNTNVYSSEKVYAFVICQYKENDVGYCYPNICYELSYSDKLSEEKLETLKMRNDWGGELDQEKCKAVPVPDFYGYRYEYTYQIFCSETGKEAAYCMFFDKDMNGKELHAIAYVDNSVLKINGTYELYLMILDAKQELLLLEKVEDVLNVSDSIISAKDRTDWIETLG